MAKANRIRLAVGAVIAATVSGSSALAQAPSCAQPAPVCAARESVFAISAFDPVGSAVRIGPDTLVTVRHVVADEEQVTILLEDGTRRSAQIVPTGFQGDLVLLKADGLPDGPVAKRDAAQAGEAVFTVGADVSRRTIVAYDGGEVTALPAEGFARARLYSTAYSQPGNSGGALVDADGNLVGIVASGGEGRFEAFPASAIEALKAQSGPGHRDESAETGAATRICILKLDALRANPRGLSDQDARAVETACRRSNNRQNLDLAAQTLGQSGRIAESIALYEEALAIDPNAVNTRIGLAVSLHIAGRYEDEVMHLKRLMEVAGEDAQVLRLAIQAGIWGGDAELAEKAYATLARINPQMAPAARRFLDNPPPRPKPRP